MEIYTADTRLFAAYYEEALPLLSPERRTAVQALRQRDAALRSLCAGLLLRRYVGGAPLRHGTHGKPFLPGGPFFSLSHSGFLAVLALHGSEVGVDTEPLDRPWREAVVSRVFTPEEQRWLAASPAERFFFLWTRKEAVLKCCGRGFSLAPASFCVLPEHTCVADGLRYRLSTERYVNHFISAAVTDGVPRVQIVPAGPEILLA